MGFEKIRNDICCNYLQKKNALESDSLVLPNMSEKKKVNRTKNDVGNRLKEAKTILMYVGNNNIKI